MTYTPFTGVRVSPETLLNGHGCGTAPGDVSQYAIVVQSLSDAGAATAITANAFSCSADAVFQNLPSSALYRLDVFLYAASSSPPCSGPGLCIDAGAADAAFSANASFVTTCWATQISGNNAQAQCQPLTAGPLLGSGADSGAEAGDAADAAEQTEAQADAEAQAEAQAEADAQAEGGAGGETGAQGGTGAGGEGETEAEAGAGAEAGAAAGAEGVTD